MSKWIKFEWVRDCTKTKIWNVCAIGSGDVLGIVKWHGAWRRYAFFPKDALFEEQCLRDIADFIELKTKEHRLRKVSYV